MSCASRLPSAFKNKMVNRRTGSEPQAIQIEFYDNLAATRGAWDELHQLSDASPYQSLIWVSAWIEEIGKPHGWTPFIVIVRGEAGEPLFLLPLVERRRHGLILVEFAGGKHSNLNMPLIAPGAHHYWSASIIDRLTHEIRWRRSGAVVLRLTNMPSYWRGQPNPLIARGAQHSPSSFHAASLDDDVKAWLSKTLSGYRRRKLNYNMRKLTSLGSLRWLQSFEINECDRIIDAFVRQKSEQLDERGISNPFREGYFRQFLRRGWASRCSDRNRLIELYALEVDGEIVATLGATVTGSAFSVMFMSFCKNSRAAKFSPGELLLWNVVNAFHKQGYRRFDLGIGEAPYKTRFCPEVVSLYDLFVGLSIPGRIVANGMRFLAACKGWIKHRPALLARIQATLRLFARLRP